eukprot:COSAG02_NODE_3664_length_6402_cov_41.205775_4_plen_79_part_00
MFSAYLYVRACTVIQELGALCLEKSDTCERNLNAGVATAENNQLCTLARSIQSRNRIWRRMGSSTGAQESLAAALLAV